MRIALALGLAISVAGCVTQDTYRQKELEAEKYHQDLKAESAKRADLEAKLKGSADELAAARKQVSGLQAEVNDLSSSKQRLELTKVELEKKSSEYEQLAASLQGEIRSGRVELSELRGRMTVKMKDKVLFPSGSALLNAEGKKSLQQIAAALQALKGKVVRVEGHTDNVPTRGGPFATNWELSTARALAVVRFLQESGVDPARLGAAGYGEYQPIVPNDTPEGRAQNRRIEIVLAPDEPPPAPQPAPEPAPAKM
jgi:chemotaxis protein MotB